MAAKNKLGIRTLFIAIFLAGCGGEQDSDATTLDGAWMCSSTWTSEIKGAPVKVSYEQLAVCEHNELSIKGNLAIGDARWWEIKKGTCHASKEDLFGTLTTLLFEARNTEAEQFEKEQLEGKVLGDSSGKKPQDYRVRTISRSETKFTGLAENGREIHCGRLPNQRSAWDRKDAHRKCKPMIAAYPETEPPSCRALHMCANESVLSRDEQDKLYRIIKAKPDCPEP
jgi:hypothetical protein